MKLKLIVLALTMSVVTAQAADRIAATKTGVEQYIYSAATSQALAYGLACVFLALFTGWLAGVIFRRD